MTNQSIIFKLKKEFRIEIFSNKVLSKNETVLKYRKKSIKNVIILSSRIKSIVKHIKTLK